MFEVLKYIHENIGSDLELADVAKHFGYSKWYFCAKASKYILKTESVLALLQPET